MKFGNDLLTVARGHVHPILLSTSLSAPTPLVWLCPYILSCYVFMPLMLVK